MFSHSGAALAIWVAPARERGLKLLVYTIPNGITARRSREGAWIEIGLKVEAAERALGRSREGAWIEIS